MDQGIMATTPANWNCTPWRFVGGFCKALKGKKNWAIFYTSWWFQPIWKNIT